MSIVTELKGSESRDLFRYFHKQIPEFEPWFSGSDGDFFVIDSLNEEVRCLEEYKQSLYDPITKSQKILYRWVVSSGKPVFLVVGRLRVVGDMYSLKVYTYPDMEKISDNFVEWEKDFRQSHKEG